MSFKQFFKNEQKNKNIALITDLFNKIFENKLLILFIIFLFCLFKTITYNGKFIVFCGKIKNIEKQLVNNENSIKYYFYVANKDNIEKITVDRFTYEKYEKIYKNSEYCDEYTDKFWIFWIFMVIIFGIVNIGYLIHVCSEY